jgi:hypothetical protein
MFLLVANTLLALSMAGGQASDRPRYGTASDLRGLTHVFIDAGADTKARDRIVRELRASGIPLVLVQDVAAADILLEYGVAVERRTSGWVTNTRKSKDKDRETSVTTATEQKIQSGSGGIFVMREGQPVLIESFADDKKSFLERDPATNFSRAFLRLYRQVNGLSEPR